MAVSLGFKDRMILVNQRCAKKEGIFEIMVSNTDEFDTFDEIVPIIEKSVTLSSLGQVVLSTSER